MASDPGNQFQAIWHIIIPQIILFYNIGATLVPPDRGAFVDVRTSGRYCFRSICRGLLFASRIFGGGLTFWQDGDSPARPTLPWDAPFSACPGRDQCCTDDGWCCVPQVNFILQHVGHRTVRPSIGIIQIQTAVVTLVPSRPPRSRSGLCPHGH